MTAFKRPYTEAIIGSRAVSDSERKLTDKLCRWADKAFSNKGPVFMLTLTCKQAMQSDKGDLVWLSPEILRQELEVYFRKVNWQVYKNAARRGKKAIERFCVVEGGPFTGKRTHVHLLVMAPPSRYIHPMRLVGTMLDIWRKSPWGMADVHWEHAYDVVGAVEYMLKTGLDAVDWHNTQV